MGSNPIDPNSPAGRGQSPHGVGKSPQPTYKKGHMNAKPLDWLGMHFTGPEAGKLWEAIMQQLNTEIKKDQEKALKALKKLRKSPDDDSGDD